MKLLKVLSVAAMLAASPLTMAAAPAAPAATAAPAASPAAHMKAVQDMLAAMQADKMMRTIAGSSRYSNDAHRDAVFAKLDKVPAAQIFQRLAVPVSKLVSTETALEMTRYYSSSYGQKILKQQYNSRASFSFGAPQAPSATAAERKEMKRPQYIKASKEFAAIEPKIRKEGFNLLQVVTK